MHYLGYQPFFQKWDQLLSRKNMLADEILDFEGCLFFPVKWQAWYQSEIEREMF